MSDKPRVGNTGEARADRAGKAGAVVTDRLLVSGGLDIEARRVLIASAAGVISKADECIELDCSEIDALDDPTLGMLVMIARNAQRRGLRVVLDRPSVRMRHDLDAAGVSYLFTLAV